MQNYHRPDTIRVRMHFEEHAPVLHGIKVLGSPCSTCTGKGFRFCSTFSGIGHHFLRCRTHIDIPGRTIIVLLPCARMRSTGLVVYRLFDQKQFRILVLKKKPSPNLVCWCVFAFTCRCLLLLVSCRSNDIPRYSIYTHPYGQPPRVHGFYLYALIR